MNRWLSAVAVVAICVPGFAQDAVVKKEIENRLTLRIDVDFKELSIAAFMDYIAEVTNVNVFVDATVRNSDAKVTLKVTALPVKSVLNIALAQCKLAYGIKDGVLRVASAEEFQKDVKLEIIDVRDVLYPIQDFPGVELTLIDSGGLVASGGDTTTPAEFPLVDLIKAHTGGKTWDDNPKASINLNNGLLVVKQTPEVIRQIYKVIAYLRQNK